MFTKNKFTLMSCPYIPTGSRTGFLSLAASENISPISAVLNHDRANSSKDRPTSSRITGYHAFYKSVAVGI